jgi:hypothetical protein
MKNETCANEDLKKEQEYRYNAHIPKEQDLKGEKGTIRVK